MEKILGLSEKNTTNNNNKIDINNYNSNNNNHNAMKNFEHFQRQLASSQSAEPFHTWANLLHRLLHISDYKDAVKSPK